MKKRDEHSWTDVFVGQPWQALALRSELEESGIPAFVPDANTKAMDPFATGAGALSWRVVVPARFLEEALELVPPPAPRAAPDPAAERDPSTIGRRLRWASLLGLFVPPLAPWSAWLALRYLDASRGAGPRPARHGQNLAAASLALAATAALVPYVLLFVRA